MEPAARHAGARGHRVAGLAGVGAVAGLRGALPDLRSRQRDLHRALQLLESARQCLLGRPHGLGRALQDLRRAGQVLRRALQVLRRPLRVLGRALQVLVRALSGLRGALQVPVRGDASLRGAANGLRGAHRHLRGTLTIDLDGLLVPEPVVDRLRSVLDVLRRAAQILIRALQVLDRALPRLRRALQIAVRALQVLVRALQVLDRALRYLRRALQVLQAGQQHLRRTLQALGRALRGLRRRGRGLRRGTVELGIGLVEVHAARRIAVGVRLVGAYTLPVGHTVPNRTRRSVDVDDPRIGVGGQRVEGAILLADPCHAVDLHRAGADGFGVVVPVAVGRHDREVLLARVLDRILRHAGIDAIGLAGVVATDPGQAFTRRRGAAGLLREQFGEPGGALGRIEVGDRQVLGGIDRRVERVTRDRDVERVLRVDRDEADPEAVGERREGQARRALDHGDPDPVERVPDGEVGLLRATDQRARPGAAVGGRLGRSHVEIGAGRRRIRRDRGTPGVNVVKGGRRRIGPAAGAQRRVVVRGEIGRKVDRRHRQDVVYVVRGTGERRRRKEGAIRALRQRIRGRRVVVENVALRALVADPRGGIVRRGGAQRRLDFVRHVAEAHRVGRVHQQHDVRLDLGRIGARDGRAGDIGLGGAQRRNGEHQGCDTAAE